MRYRQIISFLSVAILFVTSTALCADLNFKSEKEWIKWLTFYYQNPTPKRVPTALTYFTDSLLPKKAGSIDTTATFFVAVFKKDNSTMRLTFDYISPNGSDDAKAFLIAILHETNTAESKALLKKVKNDWKSAQMQEYLARCMTKTPIDLYSLSSTSGPKVLDMWWAAFFATGDALPVRKVISAVHLAKDAQGIEGMVVGSAANWSLKSNAQQHPKVLKICKEELATAKGETKIALKKIVEELSNKQHR